jgi:hypothetical protein
VSHPVQTRGHQLHLKWSEMKLAPAARDCKGAGRQGSVRLEKNNVPCGRLEAHK